ncbi:MAG: hypothetical protein ABJA37_09010 [Ferruginibacter sp.]
MKKLTTIFLSGLLLNVLFVTGTNAQTLGERVSAMHNNHGNNSSSKNRDYNTKRNDRDHAEWNHRGQHRRSYNTHPGARGKHKGWFKHDNGKHKGWYKNNKGYARKHD